MRDLDQTRLCDRAESPDCVHGHVSSFSSLVGSERTMHRPARICLGGPEPGIETDWNRWRPLAQDYGDNPRVTYLQRWMRSLAAAVKPGYSPDNVLSVLDKRGLRRMHPQGAGGQRCVCQQVRRVIDKDWVPPAVKSAFLTFVMTRRWRHQRRRLSPSHVLCIVDEDGPSALRMVQSYHHAVVDAQLDPNHLNIGALVHASRSHTGGMITSPRPNLIYPGSCDRGRHTRCV
jgi:hypothetical protein